MLRKHIAPRKLVSNADAFASSGLRSSGEISHIRHGISRAPVVLLVERDSLLRWALYETLTDAGFRVLSAPSGACAESWLREMAQDVSAALIDDDVWPLGGSVRALLAARWPGLPIVVMVHDDGDPSLETRMREHGATEFLVKPFDLPDLVNLMESLTRYRRAPAFRSSIG